ncbi:MAG: hypothetical protein CMJ72_06945 [Planctomycetaceae bacterium]|nr:hypothetical protein [Planctomycetaceae bacterium]
MATPIVQRTYSADEIMTSSPPIWSPVKQLVFDLSSPLGTRHRGELQFRRWYVEDFPELMPSGPDLIITGKENVYDYVPLGDDESALAWHVNFADPELFVAYGSPLMAQDEIQAAEHPVLGALREKLLTDPSESITLTVEAGEPTPITIANIERRCIVMTDADQEKARPNGLYGNRFAKASPEIIRNAVIPLNPSTQSNLIAMAAPYGGFGEYDRAEVKYILQTAYTGFDAVRSETMRLKSSNAQVHIHTGFWGCGAFGGNRLLMLLLQIYAAKLAQVNSLVIHTVDQTGSDWLKEAQNRISGHLENTPGQFIQWIVSLNLRWGESDGN